MDHWILLIPWPTVDDLRPGSTLVMRAITLNERLALQKAVAFTARNQRASQLLYVTGALANGGDSGGIFVGVHAQYIVLYFLCIYICIYIYI